MWPAVLTPLLRARTIIHTQAHAHTHCKIVEFGGRKELILMLLDQAEYDTLLLASQSLSRNDRSTCDNRTHTPPFGVIAAAPRFSLDRWDFEQRWIIYFIFAERALTSYFYEANIAVFFLSIVHQESQIKVFLVLWKSYNV